MKSDVDGGPYEFRPVPDDHPHDLWAVGADLSPATLLRAYAAGLFPMRVTVEGHGPPDPVGWWSPVARGVIRPSSFRPARSLRRSARRFTVTVDRAFAEVMRACAAPQRPHGWIDETFVGAYGALHRLGYAHSIEAWEENELVGGIYGVELGGLFAAESMFHRRTDAGKVALWSLLDRLANRADAGMRLVDVQWLTPHLAFLGAVEMSRATYRAVLERALELAPVLSADAPRAI